MDDRKEGNDMRRWVLNDRGELVEVLPDPRPQDERQRQRSLRTIMTGWVLPRTRILR